MALCFKRHPMIEMEPEGLTDYQLEFGSWWKCNRCHTIAIIPREDFLASLPRGRHRL